jgi:hypothetical protein
MNNCYAKVVGGVGNQLFIIAACYAYSKKYNKRLIIDTSSWHGGSGSKNISEYTNTIFKNFETNSGILENDSVTTIHESDFNYREIPYYDSSVSFSGYFQSLKYFEEYKDDFINKLCLPEVDTSFIKEKNVAFHMRLGDYLKYPNIYGDLTNYFIQMFEVFGEEHQINVFTDSPEIVRERFKDYNFNLIHSSSELEDLTLISQHDNVVCSNSTFSWWGAILGKKKESVIVPDKWLFDRECRDIYHEGMFKYEV